MMRGVIYQSMRRWVWRGNVIFRGKLMDWGWEGRGGVRSNLIFNVSHRCRRGGGGGVQCDSFGDGIRRTNVILGGNCASSK